jgi:hypothetical protein
VREGVDYPRLYEPIASLADCMVIINGAIVEKVESITWTARQGEPARATLTFYDVAVDVVGQLEAEADE